MDGPILLGVDGGGTHCRVRARYADGRPIGEAAGGTANILAGLASAVSSILAVADAALAKGGLGRDDFSRCFAGLGLAGANVPSLAETLLAEPLPFAARALESDAVVACRGAHGEADGAIAILGTGTAYVVRASGAFTSIAGWGLAVSDGGSGADLGRRALAAALLAFDGIGPASELTEAMLNRFDRDPGRLVEFADAARPRDFGGFAPLVLDGADAGDRIAGDIVAAGLASVEPALRRLQALGATRIALLGGLAARYRPRLSADLGSVIIEPAGDAMDGALRLAETLLPKGGSRAAGEGD